MSDKPPLLQTGRTANMRDSLHLDDIMRTLAALETLE